MENLPPHLSQRDRDKYLGLSKKGSARYETLYMSGQAVELGESAPRGIPADDFNVFATMVYAFADNRAEYEDKHRQGELVRHIDTGTGPSLYPFIASLPYADEMIPVDLSPANIERLQLVADEKVPLASHWQSWLEIAEILHDIGDVDSLITFDANNPHLYDTLRSWPNLNPAQKKLASAEIYSNINVPLFPENPYAEINLQKELPGKLKPRQGDIINGVRALQDLAGTADIETQVFFTESVDDKMEVVARAQRNAFGFAKKKALFVGGFISKTTAYTGFFTPDELRADPDLKLVEMPATSGFFQSMVGEFATLTDRYHDLWRGLEKGPTERKMVRPGSSYGSAVTLVGRVENADSSESINNIKDRSRIVTATMETTTGRKRRTLHCVPSELPELIGDLTDDGLQTDQKSVSVVIKRPA